MVSTVTLQEEGSQFKLPADLSVEHACSSTVQTHTSGSLQSLDVPLMTDRDPPAHSLGDADQSQWVMTAG